MGELLIISMLLGFGILVVSRYSGHEPEICNNWIDRLNLWFILFIVWMFNSGIIWLVIYLISLRK